MSGMSGAGPVEWKETQRVPGPAEVAGAEVVCDDDSTEKSMRVEEWGRQRRTKGSGWEHRRETCSGLELGLEEKEKLGGGFWNVDPRPSSFL